MYFEPSHQNAGPYLLIVVEGIAASENQLKTPLLAITTPAIYYTAILFIPSWNTGR
jgi:hypothetical protein